MIAANYDTWLETPYEEAAARIEAMSSLVDRNIADIIKHDLYDAFTQAVANETVPAEWFDALGCALAESKPDYQTIGQSLMTFISIEINRMATARAERELS